MTRECDAFQPTAHPLRAADVTYLSPLAYRNTPSILILQRFPTNDHQHQLRVGLITAMHAGALREVYHPGRLTCIFTMILNPWPSSASCTASSHRKLSHARC